MTAATDPTAHPSPTYEAVAVGDELPSVAVHVRREDLVRYAGASGDFNPIHWNPRAAAAMGLPDVIAHGMLTMGQASRVVTAWVGDPARIAEYSVRFANPVVVPDDADGGDEANGVTVTYTGTVGQKLDDHRVRIDLTGSCGEDGETKVLGAARAIVQL